MRKSFYTSNKDVLEKLDTIENQSQYINTLILNDIYRNSSEKQFCLSEDTLDLLLKFLIEMHNAIQK